MNNVKDFKIKNGVLEKYTGSGGDVVIPDGVTTIGDYAFSHCSSLRSIIIPESVKSIGDSAFYACRSLSSITIPDGVTTIGGSAFFDCSSLRSITIPEGVTTIGEYTFCGCRSLRSITIPEGVTTIGEYTFCGCSSLRSITIPEGVTTIGEEAFFGCEKLDRFIFLSSECKIGKNPFGDRLPKGPLSCIEQLYPCFTDGLLKQYIINESVWSKLASDLQAEIFMARQGKALYSAYEKCVTDLDVLGRNILARLSEKPSAKECNSAANFMLIFSNKVSSEILQQLYEALKPLKAAAKALKTIEKDASLNMRLNSEADATVPLSEAEKIIAEILQEEQKTSRSLSDELKQLYSLELSDLPKVAGADGKSAPNLVLAYLLTAHEKKHEYSDAAVTYEKPGVYEHAAKALALLNQKSLQNALLTLADKNLGITGRSKKMFLAYPICRYADETLMAELTKRAPKWASSVSGKDAPPLYSFRKAALYSETRSAMSFADKFGDLNLYAEIRGIDEDTIRDQFLSDVGLDETGRKTYDLGNQTVTARLQKDLSFLVELPAGKTAKSLPKKGADPEKYDAANADFFEMKKSAKKIVKNRAKILFEDFLSGRTREAHGWKKSYLKNPLLYQVGSLVVWAQDGKTFLLTDAGAVTADGTPYSIGDDRIAVAHPMEMTAADVTAWQKYFTSHGLKQPFDQIWEPVHEPKVIAENRYAGCRIPYYRFLNQEKHGIHVEDENFHEDISIFFDDCDFQVERIDWERHAVQMDDRFEVQSFIVKKFTRKANHIIAYLDRVTIYDRIRKDDTGIAELLPQFTLAQITEFIRVATENNCTNVTALLLDYKNQNFADFDPMEEFSLEL